ncbi:unnamed protein product [Rotaria sp. Silwood2]|nr:unnamed protein product [Rotaria sp. Silwood2]CAF4178224.1 unnamed protein product [Rotaria sp. Silwood2]
MSLPQQPKGGGRDGQRTQVVFSLSTDDSPSAVQKTSDVSVSSVTDNLDMLTVSQTIPMHGRGRGAHLKQKTVVPDPHFKVLDLTVDQFQSNTRPLKPQKMGKFGECTQVMVNYFPVVKYPDNGFAYQYYIEIETKTRSKISRFHRRMLYDCWLNGYCRTYSQLNKYRIVFDNDHMIFTYGKPLPNVDETGITQHIMAPNTAHRQEEYQIVIKQVGNPIDLNLLCCLNELYRTDNNSNINLNDVRIIHQMLSIVLHQYWSSNATHIYNRSYFVQPTLNNQYGYWDLGLGKAAWRGFYSCLVLANGTHRLLMDLGGKRQ